MLPHPIVTRISIFVLLLTFLAVVSLHIFTPPNNEVTIITFVFFGWLACLALFYGVWVPYLAKKIYKQQKTMQEPFELEPTAVKIIETSSRGISRLRWTDFHKYKLGKDIVLVYQSDPLFQIFPKRWFSEDEYREFRQILKGALGKPKS
ncbi:MAG: YcxB family protein [Kaiparowitsia implicata GSE-PSE-MK54-09C]|jgi:hypothetical protein|nr:YcxB family protein [Kaiparowitsia implicata GSE-PSE-MK54-09C]